MTQPITIEQLAQLLPRDVQPDAFKRDAFRAEWTTSGTTWSISANWHPTRPVKIAILGPAAAVILDDPTADAVQAHLRLLGAIQPTGNVHCPHPGCTETTDYVEAMDHHLYDHDQAVAAWRAESS